MHRSNVIVTIVLAALTVLLWADVWYMFRYRFGDPTHATIMAVTFTGCSCLGWVLVTHTHTRGDDETRCRKCKYILRGISEPRCPECGERI